MIKLLYIPSGECIQFVSSDKVLEKTEEEYTFDYYMSQWYNDWKDSPQEVIAHFCKVENEHETKRRHKIPTDISLDEKEFELIET